eukprot:scaffold13655_cov191-Amphora_coffeaeformis.AAC.1
MVYCMVPVVYGALVCFGRTPWDFESRYWFTILSSPFVTPTSCSSDIQRRSATGAGRIRVDILSATEEDLNITYFDLTKSKRAQKTSGSEYFDTYHKISRDGGQSATVNAVVDTDWHPDGTSDCLADFTGLVRSRNSPWRTKPID